MGEGIGLRECKVPGTPMAEMKFVTTPLLTDVPGLVHGFGLRHDGTRAEARAAAEEALRAQGNVYFLRQVHGCVIATPPWTELPDADASWTAETGTLLAIETADCLPVLIVDPVHRRVAAAHAGWRGTVAKVARVAARTLVATGSDPRSLVAALGPSIGACCYEVGSDVEEAFGPEGARFFSSGHGERKHVDVAAANRAQLEAEGVLPGHIEAVALCTKCRPDLFYSYRRDQANAGRMISVIGFSRTTWEPASFAPSA